MAIDTGSGTPAPTRHFFADLTVNIKILTAVSIAVLVALIVGIVGLRALSAASTSAQVIYSSNVKSIKAVGDIKSAMSQARVDVANHVISTDNAVRTKYERRLRKLVAALKEAGFLVNAAQPDVIRLAPPLIVSAAQADALISALDGVR